MVFPTSKPNSSNSSGVSESASKSGRGIDTTLAIASGRRKHQRSPGSTRPAHRCSMHTFEERRETHDSNTEKVHFAHNQSLHLDHGNQIVFFTLWLSPSMKNTWAFTHKFQIDFEKKPGHAYSGTVTPFFSGHEVSYSMKTGGNDNGVQPDMAIRRRKPNFHSQGMQHCTSTDLTIASG